MTFDGGGLQFLNDFTVSPNRQITLEFGGGRIDVNGLSPTISQGMSGPAGLTVTDSAGGGALIVTGASTYAGGTTVSSGSTLQIGNGGASGSIVGDVADYGALVFDRSDAVTFRGAIGGAGSVTQNGAGTLTLTGANSYSGGTLFNAGFITASAASALGAPTGALAFNGGGLQFFGGFAVSPDRQVTLEFGGGTFDVNGFRPTVSQGMFGPGGLTVTDSAGGGALILTGASTYTGGTTVSSGSTLQIGNGGASGSIVGDVADNGALVFDRSDAVTFGGAISGSGSVAQNGTSTLTLSGANSYSGGTLFNVAFRGRGPWALVLAVAWRQGDGSKHQLGPCRITGGSLGPRCSPPPRLLRLRRLARRAWPAPLASLPSRPSPGRLRARSSVMAGRSQSRAPGRSRAVLTALTPLLRRLLAHSSSSDGS